jgi:mono/diheme cytochrome c family protein
VIERGRYLANDVAMCTQCHTPRRENGALDETRLFAGATIPVKSPIAGQEWATQAPRLAGGGTFDERDVLSVLTTGHRRDGKVPAPPMPSFRLTAADAAAVLAYLRGIDSSGR